MTTKQVEFGDAASRKTERQILLDALEKGELVRLLAEADAGKLDPRELEAAIEQYEQKHWVRRAFAALLGKRV